MAASVGTGQLIRNRLANVTTLDPTTLALTCAVLGCAAVAAVCLPALRAARTEPVEAIRNG